MRNKDTWEPGTLKLPQGYNRRTWGVGWMGYWSRRPQSVLNVCSGKGGRRGWAGAEGAAADRRSGVEGLRLRAPLTWIGPCRPISGSLPWLLASLQVGDDVWLADRRPCAGRKRRGSGRSVHQR